jgi:ABC-type glycerol-3-phosphate transport system permease component
MLETILPVVATLVVSALAAYALTFGRNRK